MLLPRVKRIPLVNPILESVIAFTEWLLVPCLAVFVEMGLLRSYFAQNARTQLSGVFIGVVVVLFAFHVLLFRLPAVKGLLDNLVVQIKRRAVLSCPRVSAHDRSQWRPTCWLIPAPYKQPVFRYDAQQNAVEQLVYRLARDEDEGRIRFVYIEGGSGQGKTRTVFLLIHALLKRQKLSSLAGHALLYDMAAGNAVQSLLCRRLDSFHHDSALVFVDNFHRVEPHILRTVTHKLLDTAARNAERLVILLGQPSHAWRIRPTTEIRLLSVARRNSVYFTLGGVASSMLTEELLGQPGTELWKKVFGQAIAGPASVPQLYFAQAVTRKRGRQLLLVRELLELIEGGISKDRDSHQSTLACLVAIASALSLYRGNFRRRDFWRASWRISNHLNLYSRTMACFQLRVLLWRLSRIGFTPQQATPRTQLIFHEAMAEYCKDRLQGDVEFWSCFAATVKWRLSTREGNDALLQWLLSCETRDTAAMVPSFDRGLLNGTLSTMIRCLDRNWVSMQRNASVGYQYALLLDQTGRFSESRRVFAELPRKYFEEPVLAARVHLGRIEAEHSEEDYVALGNIANLGDPATTIAAEYWKIHLDAHRGVFRPAELTELAKRMGVLKGDFEASYFLLHTASRIFFDAHRHVYLVGEGIEERILHLQQLSLEDVLLRQLPQFRAFTLLYREAHFLAHEVLPGLVFFGRRPTRLSLAGGVQHDADLTLASVLRLARDSYARARDEFALYGDRESLYLQADILNLEMLFDDSDLETIRLKLIEYDSFIRKTAFTALISYPSLYFFRWHMVRYFRWIERGDQRYASGEAEANLEAAIDYLRKAAKADASCENAYGLWRIRFFLALVTGVADGNREALAESLKASRAEAVERGYWRDGRLLQTLLDAGKITPLDIRRMVLFLPLVHQ